MWGPVKIQKKGYTPKHTKHKQKENRQGQQVHDRMRAETFADYYEYEHWAEDMVDRPEITDTPIHPVNEEVETGDIDIQELEEAMRKLKNNKAPGPDEVPPELIKRLDSESRKVILELLNDGWNKESLTKDMNDARLAIIQKRMHRPTTELQTHRTTERNIQVTGFNNKKGFVAKWTEFKIKNTSDSERAEALRNLCSS